MKLLIVDDNHTNRKLLAAMVASFGDCETVDCGAKAITAFENAWKEWSPFNLILLDILMPEMDGRQVLRKIREIETAKNISDPHRVKIIMVTGLSDKKMVLECLGEGCDDFIVKPVERILLFKKFKELGLTNSN